MAKAFKEITTAQEVLAPVGAKTTVINTGVTPAILTSEETINAMATLSPIVKRAVLLSLCGLLPGESKALQAGTHLLDFQGGMGRSVVIVTESK